MSPAQLTEVLAKAGISASTLKSRIKADIIWTGIVRSKYQSSMQVNEKDIRTALETRPKDDKTAFGYRLHAAADPLHCAARLARCGDRSAQARSGSIARPLPELRRRNPAGPLAARRRRARPGPRNSSDLAPQLREILDGIPIGKLTPPEVTQQGIELFALCGKKQTTADTPAQRQVRDEMMQERFQTYSKQFLKEMRRAAMIEYK